MRVYHDADGVPLYTYSGDDQGAPRGASVEVSGPEGIDDLSAFRVVDGALVRVSIEPRRARAQDEIAEVIREARLAVITDLPGQEIIYTEKRQEAVEYLAADPEPADLAPYRFLSREVGVTAPTAYELCQLWLNMDQLWADRAADLEGARMEAKNAVAAAETLAEIDAALAALRAAV